MDLSDLNSKIINILEKSGGPLPLGEIANAAGVDRKLIKKVIKELTLSGEIIKLKSGKYAPAKEINLITGKIDIHPEGYAFLIHEGKEKDYFIPSMKTGGALNGDTVAVRLENFRGKTEARVVKVIQRALQKIVGRIEKSHYATYCVPLDKKFLYDIFIPEQFAKDYKEGDIVSVEITVYPDKKRRPEGKVLRKIGTIDDKGIENEIVLSKYNLEREFPSRVIKEVEEEAEKRKRDAGERTDFTELFTVTIDGETARDFDDAVSIGKTKEGYRLYVHIADVSHYVRPDTALDKEALKRGTSTYFPEFAIPMLPEKLSNDLCSLRPDTKRLTMSAVMDFNHNGKRTGQKFYRSIIKSDKRLTYAYVHEVLEGTQKTRNEKLKELIELSSELAEKIIKRRAGEGMLYFDMPEPVFIFDDEGNLLEIKPLERNIAHRIIENFMIEANEAVSEFLEAKAPVSVYRVHDLPDRAKLEEYETTCAAFGLPLSFGDDIAPLSVRQVCDKVNSSKYAHVLGSLLVRAMAKAEYSTENIGHFGLASRSYTHFTSPIRRYPDLLVHRLLGSALFHDPYSVDRTKLAGMTSLNNTAEQNSVQAEREIQKFKTLKYVYERSDEPFSAYISRVNANGMFVFLDGIMLQGFVHISSLEDDYYSVDDRNSSLVGRRKRKVYRVGDYVEVMVDRVSYDLLEAEFVLVKG
jgi:ribonuclease R